MTTPQYLIALDSSSIAYEEGPYAADVHQGGDSYSARYLAAADHHSSSEHPVELPGGPFRTIEPAGHCESPVLVAEADVAGIIDLSKIEQSQLVAIIEERVPSALVKEPSNPT